jgi:hypothetical protein
VFVRVSWGVGVFVNLGITMQRDNQMSDPQRLDDLEYHSPADDVAGSVLAVGVVGLDVEVCVVTRLGGQGGLESRQKRSAGSWRGWLGGGARLTGTHTLGAGHIMRLHAEGGRGAGCGCGTAWAAPRRMHAGGCGCVPPSISERAGARAWGSAAQRNGTRVSLWVREQKTDAQC